MSILEIRNLNVSAENKKILRNINLSLEEGKTYILFGKNGSGKSTLANALIGNEKYDSDGNIMFNGEDITNLETNQIAKKGVFFSFQNPVEVPGVNVSSFLRTAYNSIHEKKLSLLEFRRLLEEKCRELDIPLEFLNRDLNENFSGGEKKKMEILQLLVLNPKLIILDEVDSGLDESSREMVLKTIEKLKSDGKTLLVITHYREFLEKIKPYRIFKISDGKVKEEKMLEPFESEVLEKEEIAPSVIKLRFSLPDDFDFKPGQYLSVARDVDGKKLRTPYSIASTPDKDYGEFCVKVIDVGKASSYLASLGKGDKIEMLGPFGRFVIREESKNKDLVFISNGTGISTFMSMIPDLLNNGFDKNIVLIKGFRNEDENLYEKELSELAREHENFRFYSVLSQPENKSYEFKGYVQDFVNKLISKNFEGDFYLCGLNEMIEAVIENLKKIGISGEKIFFEKYD